MNVFYDPELELFTVVTPTVVGDPRIRCDWVEHRGEHHLVQWAWSAG